jgi:fatty-acyl-CoA synthase
MASWLFRRAVLDGARSALTFGDTCWSFGDLADRVARFAAIFREKAGAGIRIGYLGHNHPDAIVAMIAASAVGAVFVPLNARLTQGELGFIIEDAGIGLLLVETSCQARADALRGDIGCAHFLAVGSASAGWTAIDALIGNMAADRACMDAAPSDMAAIVYTSGTTGRPKGAMLTHANLWANDINYVTAFGINAHDVALIVAPVFHVSGLFVLTCTTLMMGGYVVLAPGFDAGFMLDAVERHGVTTTFGVPAMMLFLSEHPRFATADLSSLRLYIAGGAPVPQHVLQVYADRGVPVSQCYGMSEVTSATVFLNPRDALRKLGSAGLAMMLAEVRLLANDGSVIREAWVKGEIAVRGGNVSPGYWRNPQATAATINTDGWLRTGDVGQMDDEGYLFVCDRVKDMIISGGENIYPAEIENILLSHPAIAHIAVIGRPDPRWGESVAAVAVLQEGEALDLPTLQAFCEERLARYKIPRALHVVESLPLNGSGKVVKAQLRLLLEENV